MDWNYCDRVRIRLERVVLSQSIKLKNKEDLFSELSVERI
jgi:hypothetical protein